LIGSRLDIPASEITFTQRQELRVLTINKGLNLFFYPQKFLSKYPPLETSFVFLMTHPFDYFLFRFASKNGYSIVTVIHDHEHHKGDVWPSKRSIKYRISKSNLVVCFSLFVAMRLPLKPQKLKIARLGTSFALNQNSRKEMSEQETPYFLCIGRGKSYQGRELVIDAWKLSRIDSHYLLIAGGSSSREYDLENANGIFFQDGWLSDRQFESLVANSSGVLLPYVEATQSGVIPIAELYRVPVLFTKVGGLSEQVIDGLTGVGCEPNPQSIADAMKKLIVLSQRRINLPTNEWASDLLNFHTKL
jgi:glycosyltransferase involved in cell wall biosynthesis